MTWSFVVAPAEGHHAGVLPTGGLCGVVIESESVGDEPSYWAKPSKSLLRRGEVAHPNVGRRRTTHAAASDAALGRRDRVAVGMLGHSAGELAGPYQELHGLSCGNRAKRPLRVTSATVRGDSANAVLRTCAGLRI
jgi:hypothetical protein